MQQCRGATMIEVLISLFVLAIGLLGVLGMQAEGTLANQRGLFTTQAAFLAQDMADRIRVNDRPNAQGVSTGAYDNTDTQSNYRPGNCRRNACDANALLRYDRGTWKNELEDQLPRGRGGVSWDNATQTYTISVVWRERVGSDGANNSRGDSIDISRQDCGALDPGRGFSCYRMEVRP